MSTGVVLGGNNNSNHDEEEGFEEQGQVGAIAADEEEDSVISKGHEEGEDIGATKMKREPQQLVKKKKKKASRSNTNKNHIIQFVDHFTLEQPTSLVRFRGSKTIVHDLRNSQIQLEEVTTTTKTMMTTPLLEEKENDAGEDDNDQQRDSESIPTTTIMIKNVKDENTFALNALRAMYSLECLFFYGILFCFCLLTLIFLLMDIVVFSGVDTTPTVSPAASILGLLGTIFAVPLYVHGLASAMAICGMFVSDMWNGHVFLRSLGQGGQKQQQQHQQPGGSSGRHDQNLYNRTLAMIWVEWTTFCFLIGIPMLGFIIGLFIGSEFWWNIGLLTWFSCVTTYFVFFAAVVIFYECHAAVYFLRQLAIKATSQDNDNSSSTSWGSLFRHAILIRQKVQFSGVAEYVRLTNHKVDTKSRRRPPVDDGNNNDNNNSSHNEDPATVLQHNATGLYSRMTLLSCCGCIFEKLNHHADAGGAPGERLYSTADILGTRQFATFQSWSLEKMFCSNHRIQTVAVVRPKNVALQKSQMKSSLVCSIMGILLVTLTFASLIAWYAGGGAIVVVIVLAGICFSPRIRFTARVYKVYQNVVQANQDDKQQKQQDDDNDDGGVDKQQGNETVVIGDEYAEQGTQIDGIYQTYKKYRVTRPKEYFCWFVFFLEIILFLLGPAAALFVIGNYAVAILFIIVGALSLIRYYFNPAILVKELGSFDRVCPSPKEEGHDGDEEGAVRSKESKSDCQWNEKSRLSSILINVTRGPSRAVYIWIFSIFSFVAIVYTIAALNTTPEETISTYDETKVLPIGDFVYDQQNDLPYPTCRMKQGLDVPSAVSSSDGAAALLDYAFLSLWSYISPGLAQDYLDAWFGEGVAKNEEELIIRFRGKVEGGQKAVSYRLITSTADPSFGVVAVRGSTTAWEFLTDAQLWLGSALLVILRGFLPFGSAWTPILHQVLIALTFVESTSLERVALYKQTTSLVTSLLNTGNFSTLHITGHSLGGGIAIITGAQTGIPAIGISGPNAYISRDTFEPKLTEDALNTKVFNVMPNRDIIPLVDDPGNLFQEIQCRAPVGRVFACHSITRSLCEIMYQCGSQGRPGICECATKYGYPVPRQVGGNQTFSDICGDERENTYQQ